MKPLMRKPFYLVNGNREWTEDKSLDWYTYYKMPKGLKYWQIVKYAVLGE